jgi:hypothetical protein
MWNGYKIGRESRLTGSVLASPDLLYAALDTTACAVPASRDRMNFANADQLPRKSGGRGLIVRGNPWP